MNIKSEYKKNIKSEYKKNIKKKKNCFVLFCCFQLIALGSNSILFSFFLFKPSLQKLFIIFRVGVAPHFVLLGQS